MPFEYKTTRRVEFADTDMAGIMHFANFFRFMESAEHGFFRALGLSIAGQEIEGVRIGWPRVHVECDFISPLRFEDEVEIHLEVRAVNRKSIVYDFMILRLADESRTEAAKGSFTVACVAWDAAGGKMKAVPIPEPVRKMIQANVK